MHLYNINSPVSNLIRLSNITINPIDENDNLNENDFNRVISFINALRHPDLTLRVSIDGAIDPTLDWSSFVSYTKKLRNMSGVILDLTTRLTGNYDKEKINFILSNYDHVSVKTDSNKKLDDLSSIMKYLPIFFAKGPRKVSVSMDITESNVDNFSSNKALLDYLEIDNTFEIDLFSPINDKLKYATCLMEQFKEIIKGSGSINFLNEITNNVLHCPDKHRSMTIYPTGEIHHCKKKCGVNKLFDIRKDDSIILNGENFSRINTIDIYAGKCNTCPALQFCKNGCYTAMENSEEFFCSIMGGIGVLRDNFEKLKEEENDYKM